MKVTKEKMTEMSKEKTEQTPWERDLEAEAAFLEQHALEHTDDLDLSDLDAEAGFARLMERIEREKEAEADSHAGEEIPDLSGETAEIPAGTETVPTRKGRRRIHWKVAVVLAAALILVLAMGIGTMGEKVYTPEAVTEHKDGEVTIKINNEERIERNVDEEEIYQEIEDRLGILALRLGYRPKGLELYKVEILEDFGEARIQYLYNDQIFAIYMSRNFSETGIAVKLDGRETVIDEVNSFWLERDIEVFKIEDKVGNYSYFSELCVENVEYIVDGTMELKEFLKILEEIYIKNA